MAQRLFIRTLASLSLALASQVFPALASAQSSPTAGVAQPSAGSPLPQLTPDLAAFQSRLKALYPSSKFDSIGVAPVSGLYEVVINKKVAYVDSSGKYFLFGHLYDMATQSDLTSRRIDELSAIDFASLPLLDAIKTVRGTGERKLAVFSDPDCPHCKALEKSLIGLNNVTIYTFIFPIAALHPQAKAKAIAVWCAKDKHAAWDNLMLRNAAPAFGQCDHPVDRNIALAQRLGVNGTPTLFSGDGRMQAGAMPIERLETWLTPVAKTAASSGTNTAGATASANTTAGTASAQVLNTGVKR
jgi:thiol:disulfide interchange protein DsbC